MLALFSSYGSPSQQLLETPTPTPILFTPLQRISIRRSFHSPDLALFFTWNEFQDVIKRASESYSVHDLSLFCRRSWQTTFGNSRMDPLLHYGRYWMFWLLATLYYLVFSSIYFIQLIICPQSAIETSSEISCGDIARKSTGPLEDDMILMPIIYANDHGFNRGVPTKKSLRNHVHIAELFRDVLAYGRSEAEWQSNIALAVCYKQGWLRA